MKLERSNIKFPLWRKKVDSSLLNQAVTPIPQWLWPIWNIEELFFNCNSAKQKNGEVLVKFGNKQFAGYIFKTSRTKNSYYYRLKFEAGVANNLKDTFLMSYMRLIEERLRKNKPEYNNTSIEEEIPFWEFLDIEFDSENKTIILNSHYIQKPQYIELFKEIVNSHVLKEIEDNIISNSDFRIIKQDWKKKKELNTEIDAKNIIYNLIDTKNKLIYIGETESLRNRLCQFRNEIPEWEYYRFDSLPNNLTREQRVAIERLLIRTFASFLQNSKGINSMNISDYILANKKIDH